MMVAPRVAIRVDASAAMGTGHLKRCLSLAQALAETGAQTRFLCGALDSVAAQVLAMQEVDVHWLPTPGTLFTPTADAPPHASWAGLSATDDAQQTTEALADWSPDWVVVDHYAFDARWIRRWL
jgi:UDP-2,4-diacetamido-2,4,6-trideoxy-beta-L-altropyranose hydrolase